MFNRTLQHGWADFFEHGAFAIPALNNSNSPYGRNGRSDQERSRENLRRRAKGVEVVGQFAGSTFACVEVRRLRARKAFHSTGSG
jgi:hypothetical protein